MPNPTRCSSDSVRSQRTCSRLSFTLPSSAVTSCQPSPPRAPSRRPSSSSLTRRASGGLAWNPMLMRCAMWVSVPPPAGRSRSARHPSTAGGRTPRASRGCPRGGSRRGIYGVLAGIAGVLLGMFLGVSSYSVGPLTASAFSIVVLGGLGSVSGSLIAAFVVGYLETLTAYLVSPAYRTIPALLLLVIVMYIRPQGLLGRR